MKLLQKPEVFAMCFIKRTAEGRGSDEEEFGS